MRLRRIASVLAALAVVAGGAAACTQPGESGAGAKVPVIAIQAPTRVDWQKLLHPAAKYYGVSVKGAPASLAPVESVAAQTGKTPDLVEYYMDWTHDFDTTAAKLACDRGILPLLTWESWSWADAGPTGPRTTQPDYSPANIASGRYDAYILATGQRIKNTGCPVMLRLDQEADGSWYPWGVGAAGMGNTAADYVAMWRHVWRLFHAEGVTNVAWLWSPNWADAEPSSVIPSIYPGNRYVDALGVDGYLLRPGDTATSVFGGRFRQFAAIARKKPWLIAETGVAPGGDRGARFTALLSYAARNRHVIGIVYNDGDAARADWSLSGSGADVAAFRSAIGQPVWASARSGSLG